VSALQAKEERPVPRQPTKQSRSTVSAQRRSLLEYHGASTALEVDVQLHLHAIR